MSNEILSPISLDGPFLVDVDFHVDRKGPESEKLAAGIELEIPDDLELHHENGLYALPFGMKIRFELHEAAEDARNELLRAVISMAGSVSVPDQIPVDEQEIFNALKLNGVSMFYAFGRTQIELMTGQSPMGRFTIQPIDPAAYLRSIEANRSEGAR